MTVYGEPGVYAGWPANHGAWQRGDEFLVGFMRGKFAEHLMHNIDPPFEKLQARSLDGGESWKVEISNVDFMGESAIYHLTDFDPKTDILRLCGNYDTGGETCRREGAVYRSRDFGHEWEGPYIFMEIKDRKIQGTSRTCLLDDFLFVSVAWKEFWGTDATACLRWNGIKFQVVSHVLADECRAVMPAVARLPNGRVVVVLRRRGKSSARGGWIDAVWSDDNCKTWSAPVHVADTGLWNGNPPALIERGGFLFCAYGNRDDCAMHLSWSPNGNLWSSLQESAPFRQGECHDIGYPRLFKRSDGKLVCVYYWSDAGEEQRIEATIF